MHETKMSINRHGPQVPGDDVSSIRDLLDRVGCAVLAVLVYKWVRNLHSDWSADGVGVLGSIPIPRRYCSGWKSGVIGRCLSVRTCIGEPGQCSIYARRIRLMTVKDLRP